MFRYLCALSLPTLRSQHSTHVLDVTFSEHRIHGSVHDPVDGVVEEQQHVSQDDNFWWYVFNGRADDIDDPVRNEADEHDDTDDEERPDERHLSGLRFPMSSLQAVYSWAQALASGG